MNPLALLVTLAQLGAGLNDGCFAESDWHGGYAVHADGSCVNAQGGASGSGPYKRWTVERLGQAGVVVAGIGGAGEYAYPTLSTHEESGDTGDYGRLFLRLDVSECQAIDTRMLPVTDHGEGNYALMDEAYSRRLTHLIHDKSPGVLVGWEERFDLISRRLVGFWSSHPIAEADAQTFDPDWVLQTARVWSGTNGFTNFMADTGDGTVGWTYCNGFPKTKSGGCDAACVAKDLWSSVKTDGGCDDNTSGEGGFLIQEFLDNLPGAPANLAQKAVYYVNGPNADRATNGATAVIARMDSPGYAEFRAKQSKRIMQALGADVVQYPHKFMQHFPVGGFGASWPSTVEPWWPDTGDGSGGGASGTQLASDCTGESGVVNTYAEYITCGGSFSGPPSPSYGWAHYIRGYYDVAMALVAEGVPYFIPIVEGLVYADCPADWTMDATYNHASCENHYDDPNTHVNAPNGCTADRTPYPCCTGSAAGVLDCNEAAMIRKVNDQARVVFANNMGALDNEDMAPYGTSYGFTPVEFRGIIARGPGRPQVEGFDTFTPPVSAMPPITCRAEANPW